MIARTLLLAAAVCAVSTAPALAADASAAFRGPANEDRGSATLREGPSGVLVKLELKGLAPGWHAIHFHAKGDCSDPGFQSAGGHINHAPDARPHGLLNPQGPDFGDLPNVYAAADGMVHAEVFSSLVSFSGQGGRPALKDADGSAIVVHANPDDFSTQPIGGAGGRVACAVVR